MYTANKIYNSKQNMEYLFRRTELKSLYNKFGRI
jgi:hypothetical protein